MYQNLGWHMPQLRHTDDIEMTAITGHSFLAIRFLAYTSYKGKKIGAETSANPWVNFNNKGTIIINFVIETTYTLKAYRHQDG